MFRNGQLCIYELMDEDSAVRYWEGYAKIAFDAGQRSMYTTCTLKIPHSLIRHRPRLNATPMWRKENGVAGLEAQRMPDLSLPASAQGVESSATQSLDKERFTETKCSFSVTIRRDAWGVPVAIMGQWIVSRYRITKTELTRFSADHVIYFLGVLAFLPWHGLSKYAYSYQATVDRQDANGCIACYG